MTSLQCHSKEGILYHRTIILYTQTNTVHNVVKAVLELSTVLTGVVASSVEMSCWLVILWVVVWYTSMIVRTCFVRLTIL